jgi:type II secretory pathway pseudopilin PulG
MSGIRLVHSLPQVNLRATLATVLPAIFFCFATSALAQDPGAAAAAQAVQQSNQMAAQAVQQANQMAEQAAQQANQQAMQAALNSSTPAPSPRPRGYGRADKPRFSPTPGKFDSATSVTIQDSVPKASIFYTLDGTEPTTSSTPYTGPILVSSTSRLKAIAQSPIYTQSKVASAKYVIK